MGKRLLLIGGNYFPEPTGIGKYNAEMIDWLSNHGFECTVLTTYPYYPHWKLQRPYSRRFLYKKEIRAADKGNSIPVTIIRCPHYIPANPSGMRRMLSDFSFFLSSYVVVLALLFTKKHNYVMAVAPPFQVGLLGVLYAKIRGATSIYHIQDLQIDAARDLEMIRSPSVINLLFSIERFILKRTDYISTISSGMIRKVQEKCNCDILFLPNWVNTALFHPLSDKALLKKEFGFEDTDKIILYSGAIGHKQGLEGILECAKYFKDEKQVKFLICGSGPYKKNLRLQKEQLQLSNVIFYPLQPLQKFNAFLNMADIHLVLQKANAGDLVMPSKLTTILSVGGLALVTASEGTSLHQVVSSSNIGILIEPECQSDLNKSLKNLLVGNYDNIRINARRFAEENLSIDNILPVFLSKIFKDISPGNKKTLSLNEGIKSQSN